MVFPIFDWQNQTDDWPRWFAISTLQLCFDWCSLFLIGKIRLMIVPGGLLLVLSNYLQSLLVGGEGIGKMENN